MCYLHTNKFIQENIVENVIKIAITVPLSNLEFNTIKTVTTKGPSTGMKMKYVNHHAHTQSYIVQKEGKNQVQQRLLGQRNSQILRRQRFRNH